MLIDQDQTRARITVQSDREMRHRVGGVSETEADSDDGVIMGIRHRKLAVHGVQFHPESFLGEHGRRMAENFLEEGR